MPACRGTSTLLTGRPSSFTWLVLYKTMFFWRVPAPNEALLISGSKRRKQGTEFRIVTGHGSFVFPVKQNTDLFRFFIPADSDMDGTASLSWPHRAS